MMKNIYRDNTPLFLIIILALFLRIPHLNGSFWMDEAAQALEIVRPLSQQFNIVADFQPPLLHLILHFAQYFSHSEWWLRTIGALIPGLITIFFTYKLSEKLFNKNTAILASLMLSTSSFHIFYSQELRPYSLPAMLGVISMYYFYQFINDKTIKHWRLIVVNLLGMYSSYLFPFLIISQFLFIFIKELSPKLFNLNNFQLTKIFLITQVIVILGFLPWIPTLLLQLEAGGMVRKNLPGWENVVSIPQLKAIPLVIAKFIFGVLNVDPNLFYISFGLLILLLFFVLLFLKINENRQGIFHHLFAYKDNSNLAFTIYWFLLPLLTSWIVSIFIPVVRPKRLLYILPAFYILASFLITTYLKSKNKLLSQIASVLLLSIFSINIFSTFSYYINPNLQRENWKGLYQNIAEDFSPSNTIIIYSFTSKFAPMQWYDSKQFPSLATGKLFIDDVSDLSNTLKLVIDYDNVLVFDYLRDLTDPTKKIEQELKEFEFKEVGFLDYPNIGLVRIFAKPHSLIGIK
ncbi:MAG: glycosyltransferase family 39 protein [Pseudomonadales bacterium]|nr:glycosyltransferase family 39 protein [Pseudomonadales bacterium]